MLKRIAPIALLVALFALIAGPLWAAAQPSPVAAPDRYPGAPIAGALATITGMAISPLLGAGVYGAYQYYQADTPEKRAALPWYAQMAFWIPALVIVAACAGKDALGATLPPGWKKPLDVLETIESKFSGLIAAGAIVPFTMDTLSKMLVNGGLSPESSAAWASPSLPAGLATISFGAIENATWLNLLTVPFGLAVFAVVWMASHAINVLILLSPWGAIDAVLKIARTSVLGLLALSATIDPRIGAALSVLIIVVSYFVSGWAFRLTIFGSVFSWDFLTGRSQRFRLQPTGGNRMFAGAQLAAAGVPMRAYGRLHAEPENGRTLFAYRPWLVMRERRVAVPLNRPSIGRGLFFSTVNDGEHTVLILPPRYRGHEAELVRVYGFEGGVEDAGLLKAWSAVHELFGGAATRTQVG